MITLAPDAGLLVVGAFVVGAAGWGSLVSIRSAARGPAWALEHLRAVRPVVVGSTLAGLALSVLVRPVWVGLSALYVAVAVGALTVMLRRTLQRLEQAGGMEPLSYERRRAIVSRARRLLIVSGATLVVIGVAGAVAGSAVGWVTLSLGATLVATAALLSADERADEG